MRVANGRIASIGTVLKASAHRGERSREAAFSCPGMSDDQVHFRELGMTRRGDVAAHSAAAMVGDLRGMPLQFDRNGARAAREGNGSR